MSALIDYCPPCFPGSLSLPPVFCRSYTGRRWGGIGYEELRGEFLHDLCIGHIDAPNFIPAGAHCAPRITVSGRPLLARAHTIFPAEIEREAGALQGALA